MGMARTLRKTSGLCPICRKAVDSAISEDRGKILFERFCPEHGNISAPLSQGEYYGKIDEFYFPLMNNGKNNKEGAAELLVTFKCSMDCPVCYLGGFKKELIDFEPSLFELEEFIKKASDRTFILSGGEPTYREDLFEIIRLLKKYKKIVGINTNGLKLADMDYVNELKKSGIDEVDIQFCGFNPKAEEYLRGKDYIPVKLKALENLKQANIATRINALVVAGINEEQIKKIIDFALNNSFIKMVNFGTLLFIGNAIDFPKEHYLMPDDMLGIAEKQTNGKIKKENVYLFKKLEIVLSSFMNRSTCLYSLISLLVRDAQNYESIDKYINLKKIEPFLNKYQKIYVRNIYLAKAYLFLIAPLIIIFYTRINKILKDLFVTAMAFFLKGNYFSKTSRFVYVLFTVECDPYRMDYAIHNNCPRKSILFFDISNHKFVRKSKPIKSTDWLLWS